MTREAKVGLGVVAALVGFIGWSVADGVASRPKQTDAQMSAPHDEHVAVPPEVEASPAKGAVGEDDCCKGKAHQGEHANCKMKKTEPVAKSQGDPAKCPYLAGKSESSTHNGSSEAGPQAAK
jgi:hypothetical protein